MTTTLARPEAPAHQPADPFHSSAYCRHCRDERAAGLEAYKAWRATAPAHLFEDPPTAASRDTTAARRPHVYVYAERTPHTGRLLHPRRWVWSVYDADARQLDTGTAPTWAAAHELGASTLILHTVAEVLRDAVHAAEGLDGSEW